MTAEIRSTTDPLADLRAAAEMIREQHPPSDRLYWFWMEAASAFQSAAERCQNGRVKTPGDWSDFNGAVRGARTYLDAGGTSELEGEHGQ